MDTLLIWLAFAFFVTQSAILSGMNLAVFSVSRLRLEAAAESGEPAAERVLSMRRDGHATLVTILLGNVAVNVLLALIADSLLPVIAAFLVSTFVITLVGEIMPQAYFKRHALRVAAMLFPVLNVYRILLWPFARPLGAILDRWLGSEGIPWYREAELREVLKYHARHGRSEVGRLEAIGAMNFLALDDLHVGSVGEAVEERSVIRLGVAGDTAVLPAIERSLDDPFLRRLHSTGGKWMTITDASDQPQFVMDVDAFIRHALLDERPPQPASACRRPLIVHDDKRTLGDLLRKLTHGGAKGSEDLADALILVWTPANRRLILGSTLLRLLLSGTSDVDRSSVMPAVV
jgi:metal transporter CNNM